MKIVICDFEEVEDGWVRPRKGSSKEKSSGVCERASDWVDELFIYMNLISNIQERSIDLVVIERME